MLSFGPKVEQKSAKICKETAQVMATCVLICGLNFT